MIRQVLAILALVPLVGAPAIGETVVYDAQIRIDWYNRYLGERTTIESNATVTVDYAAPGLFEITALTFNEPVAGIGNLVLSEAGMSSGTIVAGVATGVLGYTGSLAGASSVSNLIAPYTGAASLGNRFQPGDVYALTDYWAGTVTPAPAGQGNWDHRSPDTRIVFGVPEPAGLLLVVLGASLLRPVRRACAH